MGGLFDKLSIRQRLLADFEIRLDFTKIVGRRGVETWGTHSTLGGYFGVEKLPPLGSDLGGFEAFWKRRIGSVWTVRWRTDRI